MTRSRFFHESISLIIVSPVISYAGGLRPPQEARVLRVISGFEEAVDLSPISYWRWSEEQKRAADAYSRLECASVPGASGRALKVSVMKPLPGGLDFYALWSTGLDYLPPETTGIRLRARVVSGRFTLSVGGPTVYFGTSDVQAAPRTLEAGEGWETLEFPLVGDLVRNYRRPVFSSEGPVIYYTRWIQEPMRLLVGADSRGELWLDDVELIASGEGRPYPVFADGAVAALSTAELERAFTFATDDREFDLSHTAGSEPRRRPAVLRYPAETGGVLEARQRGLEEMSFIGVPLGCPEGSNAFRVTLSVAHAGDFDELVVDFLALFGPGGEFPWAETLAEAPREGGYRYCLSPTRTEELSWGFSHARRAVGNGERVSLVIPFADFVCAHGSGSLRERYLRQEPLRAGDIMALALVSPFRQGRADTLFSIEKIEAVSVPEGEPGALVSYPRVADPARVSLEKWSGDHGLRARQRVESPAP